MSRSERQLAAGQVRSLRAIRKKLLSMSAEWDGFDQFNMGELERLADQCESVAIGLVPEQEQPDGELT